jgi:hypothetical protein
MKGMTLPAPHVTKFTNAEQRYVHNCCAVFDPRRSKNKECTDRKSLRPWIKYGCHCADFREIHDSSTTYCVEPVCGISLKSGTSICRFLFSKM